MIGSRPMQSVSSQEVAMASSQAKTAATSKTTNQPLERLIADMHSVEIKVTVRPDQELRAERSMALNEDTAEIRVIHFYDTPQLHLFNAGVALRTRLVKGDRDDSTVKIRPVEAANVTDEWRKLNGFKLEADCVGDRVVCSASLTVPQKQHEINEVAKGKRPIEKLFSKDQERFLGQFYKGTVDFGALRVLGPIRVLRWKLTQKHFQHQLTLEEWRLPNGEDLVEVSIKTPPKDAPQARKDFDKHLRELGLDPKGAQETKTRTALNYFVKAYRKEQSDLARRGEQHNASRS